MAKPLVLPEITKPGANLTIYPDTDKYFHIRAALFHHNLAA